MPSSDLVLNVRQVAGYPPTGNAIPSDSLLLQRGLGGAYLSIGPAALVSTALASPGADMAIGGQLQVESVQGGSLQFANGAFGLVDAQQACIVNLNATWGSIGTLNADLASFVQAQITSLGVSGDMQVGGTANMASAVVQTNLTASYANVLQTLDAANLNVASLAEVCNLIVNGNLAVPNGAATVGGSPILTIANSAGHGFAPLDSPAFIGNPTAPSPPVSPADNSTSIATTAFVVAVVNQLAAQVGTQFAPLTSPAFLGLPTAATAAPGNSTAQLATTAFVMNAVAEATVGVASFNTRTGAVTLNTTDVIDAGGAPIQSPAFLGSPTAPTAGPGTNTTQIATCAFVTAALVNLSGYAPLNSPNFIGTPTAPTPAIGNSSSLLATTQFVQDTLTAIDAGVISFNGRAGVVTLSSNDISAAGGAPLGSPALYGIPTAPTAPPGTNTTQLATCAFIQAAIAAIAGVASFNGRTGAVTLTALDVTTVVTIPAASTALPLMNGTANAGNSTAWSAGNHVHPVDTSRAAASALANYLLLTGGTLSGGLIVNAGQGGVVRVQDTIVAQQYSAGNCTFQLNNSSGGPISQWYWAQGQSTVFFNNVASLANIAMGPSGNINITCGAGGGMNLTGGNAVNITSNTGSIVLGNGTIGTLSFNGDIAMAAGGPHNFLLQNGLGYQNGGGSWSALSDARIKTVEGDYAIGLKEVLALRPVEYVYKGNDALQRGEVSMHAEAAKNRTKFVGLVAQEAELVFPGIVGKLAGFIDGNPVDDLRTLNASNLAYALVNAVKELVRRIEQLEARTA
jgi:hypothetical protein